MIIAKDLRVDVLGEPLFEKVNFVIRPGERIAVLDSKEGAATTFLSVLAGELEMDGGTVATEGERIGYVSREILLGGASTLAKILHTRPTFLFFDASDAGSTEEVIQDALRFIQGYRGGMLIAAADERLILAAKVTRVFEIVPMTNTITSYTGSYADYLVEREKNHARVNEAYEKQQKEKRRLEEWLEQKRKEAVFNRSPERGAAIRAKVKYLKREILDKELPKPPEAE